MTSTQVTSDPDPYIHHLERHRSMWERKPAVRALYRYWYKMIVNSLAELAPTVEIGCGCGNFKEYYPDAVATDAFETPWCEQVVDACSLPYGAASIGNLVLCDVLHHVPAPLKFFSEASRVLATGGRIVIIEPLITPWSWPIYRYCHHEPFDLGADLFSGQPQPGSDSSDYANSATATILFHKQYQDFAERFPEFRRVRQRPFACVIYPMTGGFQKFCLVPAFAVVPLSRVEDLLISRCGFSFLAMRILVVLEKTK